MTFRCVEPNIETNTPAPTRPTPTRPPQTTTRAPPVATASTPPHQHRPENVNLVPCVQHHRCIGQFCKGVNFPKSLFFMISPIPF